MNSVCPQRRLVSVPGQLYGDCPQTKWFSIQLLANRFGGLSPAEDDCSEGTVPGLLSPVCSEGTVPGWKYMSEPGLSPGKVVLDSVVSKSFGGCPRLETIAQRGLSPVENQLLANLWGDCPQLIAQRGLSPVENTVASKSLAAVFGGACPRGKRV